ncbi:universal stress protein [Pigmentiphaga aceris]|uniref:Universal stress protein n=1 Tax=Pigmentiphaga aceris TaxID=1940612 RepID=A0A5C0B115_9BURK|nr:universal stress protein [Pigmentiphaga aceris]QEI08318.1 universal stress protein [Pigmentiphaga aceris]
MTKIILATDGSEHSQAAAHYLVRNPILNPQADVIVVSVATRLPPHVTGSLSSGDANSWYEDENRKALQPVEDILRAGNIRFSSAGLNGVPEDAIVDYANEVSADLIVIGTHGHGALLNAVMGSVASKVLTKSSVPVLLIKKPG